MEKIFRTEPIEVDNETINLEFKSISEIFQDGDAPYLAVGATKGGKTTMCIDIIHKYAQKAAKIYYVTATKSQIGDGDIDTIPKVFKKAPTFDNLYAIWREIKEGAEHMNITVDDMLALLSAIYPNAENKKLITEYNNQMRKIDAELHTKYKNLPPMTSNKTVTDEKNLIAVEVLTRLILSGINIYGMSKLNKKQELIIKTLLSTEQKTILLIDDVTAELLSLAQSNEQRMFATDGPEKPMKIGNAMKLLLTDIFTKARRFNVILVLFVHSWGIINLKDQLTNFIIIEPQAAEGVKRLQTVGTKKTKELIRVASNKIFGHYPYHVVVVKKDSVFVTKADLNTGNQVALDTLNQNLVNAYDNLVKGLDYIPSNEENNVNDNILENIDALIN